MVWSCIVAVLCGLFVQYRLPDAVSSPEMDGEALKTLLSKGLSAPIELVPGEPFFSEDYDSAKGAFLRAADRVGAEITELAVVGDLATDFAVLKGRGENKRRALVHISGTHGAEGYAGSAIQTATLSLLEAEYRSARGQDLSLPTLVFVHALNPYGFKYSRRVNENNVDLNRNFLTAAKRAAVLARDPDYSGYESMSATLNPTKSLTNVESLDIFNRVSQLAQTAWLIFSHGLPAVKRAMVAGNYHNPKGVSYGGTELQPSARNLEDFLSRLVATNDIEDIVLIDVHTGLGPSGVDTLHCSSSNHGGNPEACRTIFRPQYDAKTGRLLGGLSEAGFGTSSVSKEKSAADSNSDSDSKSKSKSESKGKASATDIFSGYELTQGQMSDFCTDFLARESKAKEGEESDRATRAPDVLCVTEEFGTRAVNEVGAALVFENYAFFHGQPWQRRLYSERLRDVFFVNTRAWKRSVVQRGSVLFQEALVALGWQRPPAK